MSNHTTNKEHNHVHTHGESHGKEIVYMYLGGLALFFASFFITQEVIKNIVLVISMFLLGQHVISEGIAQTIQMSKQNHKFTPNIHVLMVLAAIGACIIDEFFDATLLILIFATAHMLEDYATAKSEKEISSLMNLNPTKANKIMNDGTIVEVQTEELSIGDKIQVTKGSQIPTDGVIVKGISSVNEASINGESLPKEKNIGDEVFGSTINLDATLIVEVTKANEDTVFSKILQLVQQSQESKSPAETKIEKLEPIYVKIVLVAVPLFILAGYFLFGWDFQTSFYRGMVLLTVASPCALAAAASPATIAAISNLARNGILFKGGNYIDVFGNLKAIAFDKTGTLTEGKPKVIDFNILEENLNISVEKLESIILGMESQSTHPLAKAVVEYFPKQKLLDLDVEDKTGFGLISNVDKHEYIIGKPQMFIDKNGYKDVEKLIIKYNDEGKTAVLVCQDDNIVAVMSFLDTPQVDAVTTINYLQSQGVKTVMITGDAQKTAEAIANDIGIDEIYSEVLPEEKLLKVQELQSKYEIVGMVGDGINDAPALINADIGIAMGHGTDVAMDVSDVVLMQNNLLKIPYAHKVAKKLNRIIWENIFFALFVILVLITLNTIGKMDLPLGVLVHEGSTVLVIVNGLRMLIPMKQVK